MNEVGFNTHFTELQGRHAILKERCADLLELYNHMVQVEGPNIKSRYMMLVGQFEHQVFELKTEISRWKRRFMLRQAALNKGDAPDYMAIETQLDGEFAAYMEEIKKHLQEIREASLLYHSDRLSEEEATALRADYLSAVKKLHPDINPDLPPAAADLWTQIQTAYADQDWGQVRFLAGLVDSVVSGRQTFEATPDGLAQLEDACAKLERKARELEARIEKLKSQCPFAYKVLLDDEEAVANRQAQLRTQIEMLEACLKEYEEVWNHGK